MMWMEEKYKVASDESYRDPTNILRKLKKHEAAENEMLANKKHFLDLMVVRLWVSQCGSVEGSTLD